MLPLKFAYITGCLIAFVIWITIFIKRKDLRAEMLMMSLGVSLLGLTEVLFWGSYWKPEFILQFGEFKIGLESFLICFLYGGAFGALYELITRKTPIRSKKLNGGRSIFLKSMILGVVILLITYKLLHLNLVYASAISMFTISISFIYFRKDLWVSIVLSGVLGLLIALITYFILNKLYPEMGIQWYITDGLSGIKLFNFPIEEILWHVPLAMVLSSMYEVIYNRWDRRLAHVIDKSAHN